MLFKQLNEQFNSSWNVLNIARSGIVVKNRNLSWQCLSYILICRIQVGIENVTDRRRLCLYILFLWSNHSNLVIFDRTSKSIIPERTTLDYFLLEKINQGKSVKIIAFLIAIGCFIFSFWITVLPSRIVKFFNIPPPAENWTHIPIRTFNVFLYYASFLPLHPVF